MAGKKFCLTVGEVEHDADLETVTGDITRSGGIVLQSIINYEEETAEVYIEVKGSIKQFHNNFKETDSYGFL